MASGLKSYVEQFLLNPGVSFNTDEDGNKETKAQVVDSISGTEGADTSSLSVSKLRARNAALQSEKDPRYQGKKVSRKDIAQAEDSGIDPKLEKYFTIGDDEESESDGGGDGDGDGDSDDDEETEGEGNEDDTSEEEGEDNETETFGTNKKKKMESSDGLLYEGDFNQFAEEFESEDDEGEENEDDESEENEDSEQNNVDEEERQIDKTKVTGSMKTFSSQDNSQEIKKGQYVKNQLNIYHSMFESRIIMQKVLTGMNQLPQPNTFKSFIKESDENYNKNIVSARSSAKKITWIFTGITRITFKAKYRH